MNAKEIALKVWALREITADTGMVTTRAQNQVLQSLTPALLADVAVEIQKIKDAKRHDNTEHAG
jgi:hypothetical protein